MSKRSDEILAKHFNKPLLKIIQHLHHGDICNEIETRLGLYDPRTGEDLKSRNTSFEVMIDETKKGYLIVTINKGGL